MSKKKSTGFSPRDRFQVQAFQAIHKASSTADRYTALARAIVSTSDSVVDAMLAKNPDLITNYCQRASI